MGGNNGNKKYQGKNKNYKNKNNNNYNKKYQDDETELLDATNSFDIIIDDERLKDKESLDVSFVDGKRKKNKAVEQAIEVLEEDIDYKEAAKNLEMPEKRNNEVISTIFIILFSFILGFLICYLLGRETGLFTDTKTVTKTVTETKIVVDENIVFLGDSIFEGYDVEKYYEGMNVINSGVSGNTTSDLLDNMKNRVYRYNPSKVVLLIGTNDLQRDVEPEKVVKNVGKIIDSIKDNRPYAEIYVQSVYPVNRTDDDKINLDSVGKRENADIKEINVGVEELCEEKNVTYINLYDKLVDEDGNLKLEYTKEGLHITEKGYEVITEEMMKFIDNEEASK